MSRKFLALLGAASLLLAVGIAMSAQAMLKTIVDFGSRTHGYIGPGDVNSGALAWYGMRAYSAAYAAAHGKAFNLKAGAPTKDITFLSNGNVDVATALVFEGVSGTASCTIAPGIGNTGTLTCASGSGTMATDGELFGSGVAAGTFVLPGFICTSYPCTLTNGIYPSQTVSSAVTVTSYNPGVVRIWYDQSGANSCSGPCDVGPINNNIFFISSCYKFNGRPCFYTDGAGYGGLTITSTSPPLTFSAFGERIGAYTTYGVMADLYNGSGDDETYWNNTANTVSNNYFTSTANDDVIHAMQFTYTATGASSIINIDGTETSNTTTVRNNSTHFYVGTDHTSFEMHNQLFAEVGLWGAAWSSTLRKNMCNNQSKYYLNTTPC